MIASLFSGGSSSAAASWMLYSMADFRSGCDSSLTPDGFIGVLPIVVYCGVLAVEFIIEACIAFIESRKKGVKMKFSYRTYN